MVASESPFLIVLPEEMKTAGLGSHFFGTWKFIISVPIGIEKVDPFAWMLLVLR